jgi:uncharacterized protein
MPHIFQQLPFPKASLAVLEAFSTIVNIQIDLSELSEQAKEVELKLGELLEKVKEALEEPPDEEGVEEGEPVDFEPAAVEDGPTSDDRDHIEKLFRQARANRTKAYELKRELDRLQLYREYEDRFLDLFKSPG